MSKRRVRFFMRITNRHFSYACCFVEVNCVLSYSFVYQMRCLFTIQQISPHTSSRENRIPFLKQPVLQQTHQNNSLSFASSPLAFPSSIQHSFFNAGRNFSLNIATYLLYFFTTPNPSHTPQTRLLTLEHLIQTRNRKRVEFFNSIRIDRTTEPAYDSQPPPNSTRLRMHDERTLQQMMAQKRHVFVQTRECERQNHLVDRVLRIKRPPHFPPSPEASECPPISPSHSCRSSTRWSVSPCSLHVTQSTCFHSSRSCSAGIPPTAGTVASGTPPPSPHSRTPSSPPSPAQGCTEAHPVRLRRVYPSRRNRAASSRTR